MRFGICRCGHPMVKHTEEDGFSASECCVFECKCTNGEPTRELVAWREFEGFKVARMDVKAGDVLLTSESQGVLRIVGGAALRLVLETEDADGCEAEWDAEDEAERHAVERGRVSGVFAAAVSRVLWPDRAITDATTTLGTVVAEIEALRSASASKSPVEEGHDG